jgi:uncharacterized delta-60 repeat protein
MIMSTFADRTHTPGKLFRLSLLAGAVLAFSALAIAQAGQLDPTFGKKGIFVTNFTAFPNSATAVALQSDGKIVVAGQTNSCSACNPLGALLRLTTKGTLDTTFGSGGIVTNTFEIDRSTVVVGLAIQADGKIVAAACGLAGCGRVGRFNSDGSIDTTFGSNGFANSPVGGGPVALQPDGKILVLGNGLERLDHNGQLDATFGNGGVANLLQGGSAIALQQDGKIMIATSSFFGSSGSLARYNANGSLDKSFGISGQAASIAAPSAVAVQTDGKILAVGSTVSAPSPSFPHPTGFGAVRFNSDGSIDTSFALRGGVTTVFPKENASAASGVALQSNGDIVAAGQAGDTTGSASTSSFGLARYTSNGHLDSTFGKKGLVTTSFGSNAVAAIVGVVLQSDGKIVAAGGEGGQIVVARYLAQ